MRQRNRWTVTLLPEDSRIARGFLAIGLFVLVGRVVSAAKEVAVAYRFGLGVDLDAYLFVFNLVSWPAAVSLSVASIVLVPVLARVDGDTSSSRLFESELTGLSIAIGAGLFGLAIAAVSWILNSGASGLPAVARSYANEMLVPLAFIVPIGLVLSVWTARLIARRQQIVTLLEAVPAATIALALVSIDAESISLLVWATLLGFMLQATAVACLVGRTSGLVRPRITLRSTSWGVIAWALAITLVGQVLISATAIVDQFFAARLEAGSVATLSYANRLVALLLGLGGMAISRATLPVFASVEVNSQSTLKRLTGRWMSFAAAFGLMVAGVAHLMAPTVVEVLFMRGEFSSDDADAVVMAFRYGLLQVPIYFVGMVLVSAMASNRQHSAIAFIALLVLIAKLGANSALVSMLGVNGLLVSNAVMYLVSVLGSWIVIQRHMRREA